MAGGATEVLAVARGILVDAFTAHWPVGFAVRLEAFYQHYARETVMVGSEPMPRAVWWPYILASSEEVTVFIALDRDYHLPDAAGALM